MWLRFGARHVRPSWAILGHPRVNVRYHQKDSARPVRPYDGSDTASTHFQTYIRPELVPLEPGRS
jgi:hypothetical protein